MNKSIRAAAVARSQDKCEACGIWAGEALHCDHFAGRARVEESIDTVWMLCPGCDAAKTENRPSAEFWFKRFLVFAERHNYRASFERALKELSWRESKKKAGAA